MKMLLSTVAALAMTGSALAYQTHGTTHSTTTQPETDASVSTGTTTGTPGMDAGLTTSATMTPTGVDVSVDPTIALTPSANWTAEQRALWDEHMAFHPTTWTEQQRAAFQAMRGIPPVSWTPEQRMLHEQHMASLPSTWTAEQRTAYEQQVASFRTPWMSATQTASTGTGTDATTSFAMAPASGPLSQPDNSNPERDARGIAVISAPAVVPSGFNGISGTTAMGGPLNDPATGEAVSGADAGYPACTATVTDNCIQLYERGVRGALASWTGTTGGYDANATTTNTGMGGPLNTFDPSDKPEDDALDVDVQPDGDLDVDGDLDGDGDNDL